MIRTYNYNQVSLEEILTREELKIDVSAPVSKIIDTVRAEGDEALRRYAREFDGAQLDAIEVSKEEMDAALDALAPEFLEILQEAAENIKDFHRRQIR